MPKIRKKTSNRTKIHERARLHKRIKESKRKKTKDAKKNPQWKSKHKKDPGIPNNFPYKDQVLAEVQEQRRLAAEEKLRKKEEQKATKAGNARSEGYEDGDQSMSEVDEDNIELDDQDGDKQGVGSIGAKRIASGRIYTYPTTAPVTEDDEEDDEGEAPVLINRDLPNLKAVLDQADVVVQILDARDPLSFRSTHLEEFVAFNPAKKLLFVLNKIDRTPKETVELWLHTLRKHHPTLPFRAATKFLPETSRVEDVKGKRKAAEPSDDALGADSILAQLSDWAKEKTTGESLSVAVVGVANAGKSSLVNSMLKKATLPIYTPAARTTGPTTTSLPQEVTIDVNGTSIRIVDTPGFSWDASDAPAEETTRVRCHDILIRNRGRIDRLKDPNPPVSEIVTRSNTEDLMLLYSLPAFVKGDVEAFLSGVARAQQLVKKACMRGALDIAAASRLVLRDWNVGKLRYYCVPAVEQDSAKASDSDGTVLSSLMSKKDMRKAGGLVKLTSGSADSRTLALEMEYEGDNTDESENSDDGEVDAVGEGYEEIQEDLDVDEEEEQDDDVGDEDDDEPIPPAKQKRKRTESILPPKKKVAFVGDVERGGKKSKAKGTVSNAPQPTKPSKSVSKKMANKSSSSKSKAAAESGEAYDFGRFF